MDLSLKDIFNEGDNSPTEAALPTLSQSKSIYKGTPTIIDLKNHDYFKSDLDIINNPKADSMAQFEAYKRLKQKTKDLFIDADTLRGDVLGLDRNIRFADIDALEDPNKNSITKPNDIGTKATNKAESIFLNNLLLNKDEKVQLAFKGDVDSRRDSGKVRELGTIVSKFKDDPYEAAIDNILLKEGDAVLYKDPNISSEELAKKYKFEKEVLVNAYKKAINGSEEDKERFNRLVKKSRFVDKSEFDNIARSGFGSSPFDYTNELASGTLNLVGNAFAALEGVAKNYGKSLNNSFLMSMGYNAEEAKEIVKGYSDWLRKQTDKGGFLNTEDVNPHNVDLVDQALYKKDFAGLGDVAREAGRGLLSGGAEIALSRTPVGLIGLTGLKTAERLDEKTEGGIGNANLRDTLQNLPYGASYALLNRAEGDVLFGKMFEKPVGRLLGSPAVEGASEGLQSLAETVDVGKMPTQDNLHQARNEAILGALGGEMAGGVQQAADTASNAIAKKLDINQVKGYYDSIVSSSAKADMVQTMAEDPTNEEQYFKASQEWNRAKDVELAKATQEFEEVPTQTVDFGGSEINVPIDPENKEDNDLLIKTVKFANQYEKRTELEKSKLESKILRYQKVLEAGVTEGGKEITPELRSTMEKELSGIQRKLDSINKDALNYWTKNIKNQIRSKYKHISPEARQGAIDRRQQIVDAIDQIKDPTEKQMLLKSALQKEVELISAIDAKATETQAVETQTTEPQTTEVQQQQQQAQAKATEEVVADTPTATQPVQEAKVKQELQQAQQQQQTVDITQTQQAQEAAIGSQVIDKYAEAPKKEDIEAEAVELQKQKSLSDIEPSVQTEPSVAKAKEEVKQEEKIQTEGGKEADAKEEKKKDSKTDVQSKENIVAQKSIAEASQAKAKATNPIGSPLPKKDSIFSKTKTGNLFDETKTDAVVKYTKEMMHVEDENFLKNIHKQASKIYKDFRTKVNAFKIRKNKNESLEDVFNRESQPVNKLASHIDEKGNLVFPDTVLNNMFASLVQTINSVNGALANMSDEDLAARYGVDPNDKATIAKMKAGGIPADTLAKSTGNAVIRELQLDTSGSKRDRDALAASIGLHAIKTLYQMGYIDKTNIQIGSNRNIAMIVVKEPYKNVLREIDPILAGISKEALNLPKTEPVQKKSFEMKGKPWHRATDDIAKAMNKRMATPMRVNMEMVDIFESLSNEQKNKVLQLADPSKAHPNHRDSIEAKNNGILMYYKRGKMFVDMQKANGNKPFYFTEFYGGNGRSYVDEGVFNYQLDKNYARHLIRLDEDVVLETDDDITNFKALVLISLGDKTEKMNKEAINSKYEALGSKSIDEIVELASEEEGMFTLHALTEANRANEYQQKHGTLKGFKTHLIGEIDGVTNGPAFLLFQSGTTNKDLFNKVGVFFKGSSVQSLADYYAEDNLDLYETLNQTAIPYLDSLAKKTKYYANIINQMNEINMFNRNMGKPPVMVFGYGMSLEGIKNKVAEAMIDRLFDEVVSSNSEQANRAKNILNELLSIKEDPALHFYTEAEKMTIKKALLPIAEAYSNALYDIFPQTIDYTQTLKDLGGSFFVQLQKEYSKDKRLQNLFNAVYTAPNKQERDAALNMLTSYLPSLKIYTTEQITHIGQSMPMVKINKKRGSKNLASTTLGTKDGKKVSLSIKEDETYIESGEKLGPVFIHVEDSTNMSMAVNATEAPMMNIFDAIITTPKDIGKFGNNYNKAFMAINSQYSVVKSYVDSIEKFVAGKEITPELKSALNEGYKVLDNLEKMKTNILPQISTVAQMNGVPSVSYTPFSTKLFGEDRVKEGLQAKEATPQEVINAFVDLLEDSELEPVHKNSLLQVVKKAVEMQYKDLKVAIKKNAKQTAGMFDMETSTVSVTVNRFSKDKATVFAHELIHAVTSFAIDDAYSYKQKRELRDLADRTIAKLRKERSKYIKNGAFRNNQEIDDLISWINRSPEHEIIAYGLTHVGLGKVLSDMRVKRPKAKNAFQWLWNVLKDTFTFLTHKIFKKPLNNNEYNKLVNLYQNLARINRDIKDEPLSKKYEQSIYKGIDELNKGFSKAVGNTINFIGNETGLNKIRYGEFIDKFVDKINSRLKIDLRNSATLQSLKREWFTKDMWTDKISEIAKRHTNDIERESNNLREEAVSHLNEVLGDKANDEKTTKGLIYTGIADLITLGSMTVDEVIEVMKNKTKLTSEISSREQKLNELLGDRYKMSNVLIDGLIHYMMTGEVRIPMLQTNAYKIAQLIGHPEAEQLIDELISLKAFEQGNYNFKDLTKAQLRTTLGYLNQINKDSEILFQDSPWNKIKGYSYNTFNDTNEVMIVDKKDYSSEDIQDLKDLGWKVISENDHRVILKSVTPEATWNQGFFSILDRGKKGAAKSIKIKEYANAREELNNFVEEGKGLSDDIYPIYDNSGGRYTKRYVMSKREMKMYLDLETRPAYVVGNTWSRIVKKAKSEELNKEITNLLEQDYREANDYDKKHKFFEIKLRPEATWFSNKKAFEQALIEYENQPKAMKELADLIPQKIRHEIRDVIHVRKDMKDIIFGFREFVFQISDYELLHKAMDRALSPKARKKFDKVLRIADYRWKEFIKFYKERLVVLNPVVHFGNFLSNTMLLTLAGVPISYQIKRQKQAYYALEKYKEDTTQLVRAEVDAGLGVPGANKRVVKYKKLLEENPVHESITNGLFSFIVEDVMNDVVVEKNLTKQQLYSAMNKTLEIGKKVIKLNSNKDIANLFKRGYMDVNTQEGIELVKLFQYSDFMAKDTLYHYNVDVRGVNKNEALKRSNEMFIDYRYNDSATLDYLNKIFLFPFSKFAIRIQKPMFRLMKERPLSVAVAWFLNGYLHDNGILAENFIYNTHFGIDMLHGFGSGIDPMELAVNPIIEPIM